MTKISILVIILVLMSSLVLGNLENYPEFLFEDEEFNTKIVVGEDAPSSDVASTIKLIPSLQTLTEDRIRGSMLDSDVTDATLENFNIISVGCLNEVTKLLVGECDLRSGESFIYVIENDEKYKVVIIGGSEEDTAKATFVLGNYENYNLEGDAIRIIGDNQPYDVQKVSLPEVDDEVLVVEEEEPEVYEEPEKVENLPKSQKQLQLEEKIEQYNEEIKVEQPVKVVEEPKVEIDPTLPLHQKAWIKFKIWLSWFFK